MKEILLAICLLSNTYVFAQQSFATKKEAVDWLKVAFSQRFVKTEVTQETAYEGYNSPIVFTYEISDSALLIYKAIYDSKAAVKTWKYGSRKWFYLPFNKIDEIEPSSTSTFFKAITNITFRSNCRCFRQGEGDKIKDMNEFKVKDISKFVDLTSDLTIPFNLLDGTDISKDLINAFKKLSSHDDMLPLNSKQGFDTLRLANQFKQAAYNTLPKYDVFTIDSSKVSLSNYILTHRQYQNKPTLIITWKTYYKIGLHQIDTLLLKGLATSFNVVLLSRDYEEERQLHPDITSSFSEIKNYLLNHAPKYDEDAMVLFDRSNQVEDFDNGTVPLLIWMDKDLNIIYSCLGFLDFSTIKQILSEIDSGQLQHSKDRYYDSNNLPCNEAKAQTKTETTLDTKTNSVFFKIYKNITGNPNIIVEYNLNKNGKLFFQKMTIE